MDGPAEAEGDDGAWCGGRGFSEAPWFARLERGG